MRRQPDTPATKAVDVLLLRLDALASGPKVKPSELRDLSRRLSWAWEEHRRSVGLEALTTVQQIALTRNRTR